MAEREFRFDWDDNKAATNERKHGVSFETASTVFRDPRILTIADSAHSEVEDRWFSVGWASNGSILSVVYIWRELDPDMIEIRLISARPATQTELRRYTVDEAYD